MYDWSAANKMDRRQIIKETMTKNIMTIYLPIITQSLNFCLRLIINNIPFSFLLLFLRLSPRNKQSNMTSAASGSAALQQLLLLLFLLAGYLLATICTVDALAAPHIQETSSPSGLQQTGLSFPKHPDTSSTIASNGINRRQILTQSFCLAAAGLM